MKSRSPNTCAKLALLLLSTLTGCATTAPSPPLPCPPVPQISPQILELASQPDPLEDLLTRIEREKSSRPAR